MAGHCNGNDLACGGSEAWLAWPSSVVAIGGGVAYAMWLTISQLGGVSGYWLAYVARQTAKKTASLALADCLAWRTAAAARRRVGVTNVVQP